MHERRKERAGPVHPGPPSFLRVWGILFSVTATCRRLEMDVFAYLRDVLTRLPSQSPDQLDELLPDRWLAAHPEARFPPQRRRPASGPAP